MKYFNAEVLFGKSIEGMRTINVHGHLDEN
jgi:hypothetical protein